MSKFKGTQGPWEIKPEISSRNIVRNTAIISVVMPHHVGKAECECNTRLIAAAPELLEELSRCVKQLEKLQGGSIVNIDNSRLIEQAKSVLNKAFGED